MRLGSRSPNEFIQLLNKKNEIIQNELLTKILELTKMINVKVMMGDSTITEQKTFDPKQVTNYLERISQKLTEWSLQDVSTTNNEDLRRIFTKFEKLKNLNFLNKKKFLNHLDILNKTNFL